MFSYPLKVVTGSTMASIDQTAITERGILGLYLMERAGLGIAENILTDFPEDSYHSVSILCGKGNNGGDGFVIARRLTELGIPVRVALLGKAEDLKGDARLSCERMMDIGLPLNECLQTEDLEDFAVSSESQLWIDAMLGTGSKGAPRDIYGEAVRIVNERGRYDWVVSVDIPTGVEADTGNVEGQAVLADWVYTMGLPKVGHVVPPGLSYTKNLTVLDIGFPTDLLQNAESLGHLLTEDQIDDWLPKRDLNAHKGSEGRLLVISGSQGMTGAAMMCSQAAITMGAGLLYAACPKSLHPIYGSGVWEKLTLPVRETEQGSFAKEAFDELFTNQDRYSAVVIGPGLGLHESTQTLVRRVVEQVNLPLLIDGDGLTAVTPDVLNQRKWPWVATPHPGEMARLFGVEVREIQQDRFGYASKLADSSQGVVVLKGAKSLISQKNQITYVNPTGTPAMASGGMGDVLSGMIGALLSKGMAPYHAACVGTYLHGLAAELLVNQTGAEAIRATQLIDSIPIAVYSVRRKQEISQFSYDDMNHNE